MDAVADADFAQPDVSIGVGIGLGVAAILGLTSISVCLMLRFRQVEPASLESVEDAVLVESERRRFRLSFSLPPPVVPGARSFA